MGLVGPWGVYPPVFGARVRKILEEQRIGVIRKMKECASDLKAGGPRMGIERKERENVGAPTFLEGYTPLFLRK